jgi:hypothetical protein
MQLSPEQQAIVQAAIAGKSIIINAVAGAGKTSTALAIARAIPHKSVVQVTYNRKLKQEVRRKVIDAGITNMVVTNYHSLCLDYYGCHSDIAMVEVIRGLRPSIAVDISPFQVMIVDEAQDKTPEFYDFLQVFTKEFCVPGFQMIVMGDVMQAVYDFKLASPAYLSEADRLWPGKDFIRLAMSTSYRITPEIAECVNGMAARDIIRSSKRKCDGGDDKTNKSDGDGNKSDGNNNQPCKVTLISNYGSGCPSELNPIIDDLTSYRIRASDLMVILPSSTSNFATAFLNRIASRGIPIYKQSDSEDSTNEKYSRGKVLVCTYHTAKGLERHTVVLFNFDATYYSIFQPTKCIRDLVPTLYVGLTRALSRLYIVENGERLPFITPRVLSKLSVYAGKKPYNYQAAYIRDTIGVTKLIKFLPVGIVYDLHLELDKLFRVIVPAGNMVPIKQCVTNIYKSREYVADLTGMAVGEMLEEHRTGGCKVRGYLEDFEGTFHLSKEYVEEELEKINLLKGTGPEYYLRLCNFYECCKTGHKYRYRQIRDYSWLSDDHAQLLMDRLEVVAEGSQFRRMFAKEVTVRGRHTTVIGELDACMLEGRDKDSSESRLQQQLDSETRLRPDTNNKQVVEIKCTKELSDEHKLQLVMYAWILHDLVQGWSDIEFILINVLTGETLQLLCSEEIISRVWNRIVEYKLQ